MPKLIHFLRDLLLIRRVEFRIAEIPIVAMPALLVNKTLLPSKRNPSGRASSFSFSSSPSET
jgi:hypothetical protein